MDLPLILIYDSSPSLLDSPLIHNGSPSLLDSPLIYNVDGSPSLLDSEESEADDSSVSSLSTSKSIWKKGLYFPEAVTIQSTMAVAKSAIRSNPVTQSSTRQRQAKRSSVDSPTIPFLPPDPTPSTSPPACCPAQPQLYPCPRSFCPKE